MTLNGPNGRRCPVCGSRRVIPSLGRLSPTTLPIAGGAHSEHRGEGMPSFFWRCRVCRTTMRPSQPAAMWRRRRPLSNWMFRRQPVGR